MAIDFAQRRRQLDEAEEKYRAQMEKSQQHFEAGLAGAKAAWEEAEIRNKENCVRAQQEFDAGIARSRAEIDKAEAESQRRSNS